MRGRYLADARGAAAVEFALWLALLTVPLLNAIDIGFYAFQSMQVHEAAQVAAQAAESLCSTTGSVPAATNCTGLSAELTSAAQTTSLGTQVTVSTSKTKSWEGYYCSNTDSNSATDNLALVNAANNPWAVNATTVATAPSSCSSTVSGNSNTPGDYLVITASATYTPLFGAVSVASLLSTTMTSTAWVRLQ